MKYPYKQKLFLDMLNSKRKSTLISENSFSNFSPIREDSEECENIVAEKTYNLRPKRISFSSTPKKPARYASCSNLPDLKSKFYFKIISILE